MKLHELLFSVDFFMDDLKNEIAGNHIETSGHAFNFSDETIDLLKGECWHIDMMKRKMGYIDMLYAGTIDETEFQTKLKELRDEVKTV